MSHQPHTQRRPIIMLTYPTKLHCTFLTEEKEYRNMSLEQEAGNKMYQERCKIHNMQCKKNIFANPWRKLIESVKNWVAQHV